MPSQVARAYYHAAPGSMPACYSEGLIDVFITRKEHISMKMTNEQQREKAEAAAELGLNIVLAPGSGKKVMREIIGRADHLGETYFISWIGWRAEAKQYQAHLWSLDLGRDFYAPESSMNAVRLTKAAINAKSHRVSDAITFAESGA